MEQAQLTKKIIDFQKMSFDHWFDAVSLIQNQAENTMDAMLNQSTWIPEDGRNALRNWASLCQQERGRLKSYVEKGFSALEKVVLSTTAKPAEKAKKTTTSES